MVLSGTEVTVVKVKVTFVRKVSIFLHFQYTHVNLIPYSV